MSVWDGKLASFAMAPILQMAYLYCIYDTMPPCYYHDTFITINHLSWYFAISSLTCMKCYFQYLHKNNHFLGPRFGNAIDCKLDCTKTFFYLLIISMSAGCYFVLIKSQANSLRLYFWLLLIGNNNHLSIKK